MDGGCFIKKYFERVREKVPMNRLGNGGRSPNLFLVIWYLRFFLFFPSANIKSLLLFFFGTPSHFIFSLYIFCFAFGCFVVPSDSLFFFFSRECFSPKNMTWHPMRRRCRQRKRDALRGKHAASLQLAFTCIESAMKPPFAFFFFFFFTLRALAIRNLKGPSC